MSIADDTPDSQQGKKADKSLEAITALRRAMEQRLQESKAVQVETPKPETPEPEAPKPEPPQPQAETPEPKPASAPPPEQEIPINFDPIEWGRILYHVAECSQGLIRDYMERMRHRPIEMPSFSPMPMLDSLTQFSSRLLEDPEAYTDAQIALWQHYLDLTRTNLQRLQGMETPSVDAAPADKRFKAKDWETNWFFDFLKQAYLSTAEEARRLVNQEATHIKGNRARKIEFYTRLFIDATSPSNFWLTNPEVLRATWDSKGENLIKGLQNLLGDMERGNGMLQISMSDYHAFQIGKNIATTPGKVIYQNDLMQLIQYAPNTDTVKSIPLLILPPWINKYYILDLREKNSLIGYLVAQGFTVFCVSWVNPVKRHALTQFEDYMDKGALDALREIKRATGADAVNVTGYCIGGTLLACTQAYLAALPDYPVDLPKINTGSYLVTMIDFENPGDLGVFIDEEQIRMLEDRMARQGFMDAASMMLSFNLLRANDLIWPFVINNYMLGREPFPFDILYWNADATNLPAAMHSYYLRKMYLNNKLVEPGALKMREVPIDITQIETPSFILATREDHIAQWQSAYAATQYYAGDMKFVLAGSGHVAGIVNPPSAQKYNYWTNTICPANPDEWFAQAESHKGSWWVEWAEWLETHAGENVTPREITDFIENAPGSYVKVRAV